jgi:hypothetical protein
MLARAIFFRSLPLLLVVVALNSCREGLNGCRSGLGTDNPAGEASAITQLRSIYTAQASYLGNHDHYACTMAELGSQFGLIDRQLSYGSKDGFNYFIQCSTRDGVPAYQVWASPTDTGVMGSNYYCTDQSGQVRRASNRLEECAEARPVQ